MSPVAVPAFATAQAARPSAPSVAAPPTATRARRRWVPGELARVLAVAAVPTLVYVLVVLRNLTYAWDDFIQFGVTLRSGIGTGLLTYDLFEHFGPVNRLIHGLLVTHGGLDTRWALAVAVPIFFAYCASLTDLARVLGAGWGRVALCLAVATVTPATVSIAAVLDPYLHVMLPVTATAVAAAAYVRWVSTRRFVHALTGGLVVLLACAVQERGVFLVLFLVLLRVLVIDGGVLPGLLMGRWVRTWLRDAAFLAVPILVAVATTVIVATRYAADTPRGGLGETMGLVGRAWSERFVPMLTGSYGLVDGPGRVAGLVFAHAVVVGLFVWTIRRSAWNLRPWLLLLAWFAFMMTFLGLGRLGIGPAGAVLGNLQYYVYALPAVVVLIASVRLDPARGTAAGRARVRRALPWLAGGTTAVLACATVLSSLPAAQRHLEYASAYLGAAVPDVLRANEAGPAVIAPTAVPQGLVPPVFFPYDSGVLFLRAIDPATVVDLDPDAPLFLDDAGRLTEGSAHRLVRVRPGRVASGAVTTDVRAGVVGGDLCLSADGDGRISVPLPETVRPPGGAVWVRVIASGEAAFGSVTVGAGADWTLGARGALTSGHGSTTVALAADRVGVVDLLDLRAERLCVEAIEVWALSVATGDGAGGCAWVGPFGESVPARSTGSRPVCTG